MSDMKSSMTHVGMSVGSSTILDSKCLYSGYSLISVDIGIHGDCISGDELSALWEGCNYLQFVHNLVGFLK